MSDKVKLVLTEKQKIRGKEYSAGTVVFEGACVGNFTHEDLEKRIQLKQVKVDPKLFEPEPVKKNKPADTGKTVPPAK